MMKNTTKWDIRSGKSIGTVFSWLQLQLPRGRCCSAATRLLLFGLENIWTKLHVRVLQIEIIILSLFTVFLSYEKL